MKKRIVLKLMTFITVWLCFLTGLSSVAIAVEISPEASAVEDIMIPAQHGIVKGQSVQLSAKITPEGSKFASVEWSSSNDNVIKCTNDGLITGVTAGDFAYITCKAKYGNVSKKIKVYCVESIGDSVKSEFVNPLTLVYAQPSYGKVSVYHLNFFMIIRIIGMIRPQSTTTNNYFQNTYLLLDSECEIQGRYKSFIYVVFKRQDGYIDGFVKYTHLSERNLNGFLKLSSNDISVWGNGFINPNAKLTTDYNGNIEWTVSNPEIIDFDDKTGQIIGKKPGIATITAKSDGISRVCTVHSLYRWPQKEKAVAEFGKKDWKTKTNRETNLYAVQGDHYKVIKSLKSGTSFTVYGESSEGDGWAYGCITGTNNWGYVPIADVSTKGTILQYQNMNWSWPVKTPSGCPKANYISSPYGWRDANPPMHKGIDITTGTSGEISGYEVISAFDGMVLYICDDKSISTGFCVAVLSNEIDPISGKYLVAIYMHLKEKPKYRVRDEVDKGEKIGLVGNTGNSFGYHLHFEVNNQTSYNRDGSTARNYYANLINPLFFYVESEEYPTRINSGSNAVLNYNGAYWYGDDREENKP